MFDVGFSELLLIFVIGLLVLGPERLPRVAAELGRWIGRARRMANQLRYQIEQEIVLDESQRSVRPHSAPQNDVEPVVPVKREPVDNPAGTAYSSAYATVDDDEFDEFNDGVAPLGQAVAGTDPPQSTIEAESSTLPVARPEDLVEHRVVSNGSSADDNELDIPLDAATAAQSTSAESAPVESVRVATPVRPEQPRVLP